MENKKILIYAELIQNEVQNSALELLTKARTVFPADDVQVAFVAGGTHVERAIEKLSHMGADKLYITESDKLGMFNVDYMSAVVINAVKDFDPDIVLMPASHYGEELSPTVAVKLKTAGSAHCVDIFTREDGAFVTMVPAFGGKVIGEILIPNTRPQIASVKPGIFSAAKQPERPCEVIEVSGDILDGVTSKIKGISVEETVPSGIPVEKAELIVCCGFGAAKPANWEMMEQLAARLHGATACTRPVTDFDWGPDENKMIGTSGKSARPKVYLGFGVSGASHHLCGMKDAGTIISINTDKESAMFAASDYCVAADAATILEELLDQLG